MGMRKQVEGQWVEIHGCGVGGERKKIHPDPWQRERLVSLQEAEEGMGGEGARTPRTDQAGRVPGAIPLSG